MKKELQISITVILGISSLTSSTPVKTPDLNLPAKTPNTPNTLTLTESQINEILNPPPRRNNLHRTGIMEPSYKRQVAEHGKTTPSLNLTKPHEAVVTTTPEKTPWWLLGNIDFSIREPLTLIFELNENAPQLEAEFIPVVRPSNLDFLNQYFADTAPGRETAGVYQDNYGNIVITGHSGYDPDNCKNEKDCSLEPFEKLRQFLQGRYPPFVWRTTLPSQDIPGTREDQPGHISALMEAKTYINQDGRQQGIVPVAIGIVPHDKMLDFNADSGSILDYVTNPDGSPNSDFEQFKTHPGLIVSFSGWKEPEGSGWAENKEGETPWYSHFAYVIGFEIEKR